MKKDNEKRVPELRFKGFDGDWEQRKLKDSLIFLKDGTHGSHPDGDYAYLLSTKNLRNGKVIIDPLTDRCIDRSNYESIYRGYELKDNDILLSVVGRIGSVAKYVRVIDKPVAFQRSVAILRGKDELSQEFLEYLLLTYRSQKQFKMLTTKSAQPDLFLGDLGTTKISFPCVSEQENISELVEKVNSVVALHERKFELLKRLKKAYLQKLFPANGSKVPKLRFASFTDDWEQRKLGELYAKNNERNEHQFSSTKTISIATMRFNPNGNGAQQESLANYKVLRMGDIAFEGHTSKQFAFGRFVMNDIGNGIMSPRFTTLRPTHPQIVSFWKEYIHFEPIIRKILVRSTKSGTMMNELVLQDFFEETISVSSDQEQKKIGKLFSNLNDAIALHQRKLEVFRKLKKSYLQKLFV